MERLSLYLEALVFAADTPLSVEEMKHCLDAFLKESVEKAEIEQSLSFLQARYQSEEQAFELVKIGEGYQFLTKAMYHELLGILLKQKSNKKLSKAALETLAVIAYQQPITKGEVEKIRGVNCDYAIQKLLEKELIEIKGRANLAGRPLLYATSTKFMQHFGLGSMKDLPKLKELTTEENQIGHQEAELN